MNEVAYSKRLLGICMIPVHEAKRMRTQAARYVVVKSGVHMHALAAQHSVDLYVKFYATILAPCRAMPIEVHDGVP